MKKKIVKNYPACTELSYNMKFSVIFARKMKNYMKTYYFPKNPEKNIL